jgi:hypothetical protein
VPEDNRSYWCNGSPHDISVGDWLHSDPGQIAAKLVDEIDFNSPVTGRYAINLVKTPGALQ